MTKEYYNIRNDIDRYPDAWCYAAIGGRAAGKTYSTLKDCLECQRDFIFVKRTIEDVDIICSGSGRIGSKTNEYGIDLSPFKAINRDTGSDVRAYSIKSGIGGFWHANEEGKATGVPVGMILGLNAVSKYKGFELASSGMEQWLIFDEFIPNIYDRVSRREGNQLLDLYMTVSRDREKRGLQPLKLILLANATSISNPTMQILEIVDDVSMMQARGESEKMLTDRGIFIHLLEGVQTDVASDDQPAIMKAMAGTAWAEMSFGNTFAYNDFSKVDKVNLKNYCPVCRIIHKRHMIYVYQSDQGYYLTSSRHDRGPVYDLDVESDQYKLYDDYAYDIKMACIDGQAYFQSYTMYDLIMNYRKIYNIN